MLPVGLAVEVAMSETDQQSPEADAANATGIAAPIAKVTGLILVLAGLLLAIAKLGDAWQLACKTLGLCPDQWVAEPAAELSKVIKADTAFTFPHLSGAAPGQPQIGNQRYDGDSVVSSCSGGVPIVWQLPNGKIVYDDDPLVRNGWSSSSYVGQPPGPDLARFDAEAITQIGWSPGFYAHNMCAFAQHCTISAADIQAHSRRMDYPREDCANMGVAEVNNTGADLTVWVRGAARYPVKWTVKAAFSTYK
jgi:hypothetical protein